MIVRAVAQKPRQACRRYQSTFIKEAHATSNPNNAYLYMAQQNSEELKSQTNTGEAGLLSGWSTSVKANFCTTDGLPTSCGSRMLETYQSPFEATAVALLRKQGANIVGKTNCDEFGMGSANIHSAFGPVLNPHDASAVAGGSSGGAAASVAEGTARIALASDTGGSVRLPAAYCGVFGLKPSYGLISRWGLVSYADSLDTVGIMASSVEDLEASFGVVNAFDEQDPTAIDEGVRQDAHAALDELKITSSASDPESRLAGVRIGIPRQYFPKELAPRIVEPLRQALRLLKRAGAELVPVSLPRTEVALSAYYVVASAEASSNLARYDGIRYGESSPPLPCRPFHLHQKC